MPKVYLLFLLVYVSFIFAAVTVHLAWGIYIYLLTYFVSPWTKWWASMLPEIRWVLIVGAVNLFAFAIQFKRFAHRRIRDSKPLKWLLWFSLVMVLVGFMAVWPAKHWEIVDKHVKVVIFLLLMYKAIDTPKKFEGLLWVYLIGVFYIAWVASETGRTGYGRLEGVGPIDSTDANDLGAIFVTSVPLLLFYAIEAKRKALRVVAILFLPFVLNGFVLANSRGAMLGVFVGIAVYVSAILFKSNKSFSFKMKVMAGLLACGVLFLSLTDDAFWDRQKTITAGNEEGNNADYGRITVWQYGVKLALEHPLGVGGWGYSFLSGTFLPKEIMGEGKMKAIHSTYLEALTAYGFIGLLFFLLFLYTGFRELSKTKISAEGQEYDYLRLQRFALMGCFAGYLVSGIFIDRVYAEVTYYFPVIFSIYCSLYGRAATRAPSPVRPAVRRPVYATQRRTHAAKLPHSN